MEATSWQAQGIPQPKQCSQGASHAPAAEGGIPPTFQIPVTYPSPPPPGFLQRQRARLRGGALGVTGWVSRLVTKHSRVLQFLMPSAGPLKVSSPIFWRARKPLHPVSPVLGGIQPWPHQVLHEGTWKTLDLENCGTVTSPKAGLVALRWSNEPLGQPSACGATPVSPVQRIRSL